MRLTSRESIGSLRLRRYQHARHGIVETLTQGTVVFVRPVFGLLKPDEQQQPEVAEFRTQKPKKPKRARRLGGMWKGKRSAGGEA
jgi:hypothetical protein